MATVRVTRRKAGSTNGGNGSVIEQSARNAVIESDGNDGIAAADDNKFDGAVIESDPDDDGAIDPANLAAAAGSDSDSSSGTGTRRRGRPRGSKNGRKAKGGTSQTTDSLTGLLFAANNMLAAFVHVPEFDIDKEEARILAEATQTLTELYEMPIMSEKTAAWVKFGMAINQVYGPRVVAVIAKPKKPRIVSMPPRVESHREVKFDQEQPVQ